MIRRFLKSRGASKFRRNRLAMSALAVIGVYFLLAGWIIAMETADWAGRATGAYTLRGVPVAGALLPGATLERVGPRTMAGFGAKQGMTRRLDQADLMLAPLQQALDEIDRTGFTGEQAAAALARVRFAERTLAGAPVGHVRALYEQAADQFRRLDAVKETLAPLSKAVIAAERAMRLADAVDRAIAKEGWEGASRLRDDAAAAIEDAMFALEDYQQDIAGAHAADVPIAAIDPADLQHAADRLQDAVAPEHAADLVPVGRLREIKAAAVQESHRLEADVDHLLDALEATIAELFPRPGGARGLLYSLRTSLGTDAQGRSIFVRGIYSAKVAVQVGFVTAGISVIFGALLGAAAAYFGGWVDQGVQWLYSTFSSVPNLVLLVVLAFMFTGTKVEGTLIPVYAAFCMTFWIGPCRVIRGEVMKVKELEYVQAARATGFGRFYILLKHVIPNTTHLMFISFSLLFINAIKSEVILTFLGLGLKEGASWGIMISQSGPEVVQGFFWQIGAATALMLVLVLAFNVVSDALQDAFDPKHVG